VTSLTAVPAPLFVVVEAAAGVAALPWEVERTDECFSG